MLKTADVTLYFILILSFPGDALIWVKLSFLSLIYPPSFDGTKTESITNYIPSLFPVSMWIDGDSS